MKKILILIFSVSIAAFAQQSDLLEKIHVGQKLGLIFPSMAYSNSGLDKYSSSFYGKGSFELFGEYYIMSSLSVRPGLKFATRGQHIDESDFEYELNAEYVELTVPVSYTFPSIKNIYPYVLGGPVLGLAQGGNIHYKQDGMEEAYGAKINKSNLSSTAFGLYFGAGAKYPLINREISLITVGLEIGYHFGLTDTYSSKEKDEKANAVNADNYIVDGSRKHRGLELGITLSVPLAKFRKVKSTEPEPKPEPIPEPEPEKLCYTIEEMKELIRANEDIRGKKICAMQQVSFKFGSHELTAQDKVYLDEMVILMETNEMINIKVNGHTDNIGSEEANMNLSRERAKAVHDYLNSKGIDSSRLSYEFFGATRPIASNHTEEGRILNRRVEFEIINQ